MPMNGIDFAARLLQNVQENFADQASDEFFEDMEAVKAFAALPEVRRAQEAADRLRSESKDIHPFTARMITSALDELRL